MLLRCYWALPTFSFFLKKKVVEKKVFFSQKQDEEEAFFLLKSSILPLVLCACVRIPLLIRHFSFFASFRPILPSSLVRPHTQKRGKPVFHGNFNSKKTFCQNIVIFFPDFHSVYFPASIRVAKGRKISFETIGRQIELYMKPCPF